MTKARMSALPVLQYCGQSQRIREEMGSSRDAVIGSTFHAVCSGQPVSVDMMARLTKDELSQLGELIPPTPLRFEINGEAYTRSYADADKEVPLGITESGSYTAHGDASALANGTADMAWVIHPDKEGGPLAVVVADIKRSIYGCPDGPESLQVKGYAIALAHQCGADGYLTAIWDATEGEWHVGEWIDVWSQRAADDWARVKAAATNYGGEYSVGTHCFDCFARRRCPQWLLPLESSGEMLKSLATPDGLTNDKALEMLMTLKRLETTCEEAKEILKSYAHDTEIVDSLTGKRWAPSWSKGRAALDKKKLEQDNPELVQRYMSTGAPYATYRWMNPKKEKK